MKLAIIGSRTFGDYSLFIAAIPQSKAIDLIVSGGAKGADTMAEKYANFWKIPTKIIEPDWDRFGKSAGFIRNRTIIESCDEVIAFWDGKSKGTKNSLAIAYELRKKTTIVYFENETDIERRIKFEKELEERHIKAKNRVQNLVVPFVGKR